MKKIMMILALIGLMSISAFANQDQYTSEPTSDETSIELTFISESNGTLEFLVEANKVLDDVCDYFNGSWVDTGLKIYCTFNGVSGVCIAYKITKLACGINGAVRLYIEGDYNNATKKLLTNSADVLKMILVGRSVEQGVKLVKSNMCTAE